MKQTSRYYIGQTQNLNKRLEKHSRGETKSVKNRGDFQLVYVEECSSRAEAMKHEMQIKRYKGGNAFKKLLEDWDKQTTNAELAEVPSRRRRDTQDSLRLALRTRSGLKANPGLFVMNRTVHGSAFFPHATSCLPESDAF